MLHNSHTNSWDDSAHYSQHELVVSITALDYLYNQRNSRQSEASDSYLQDLIGR
jgi:hypothetical protein